MTGSPFAPAPVPQHGDWRHRAACRGVDTEMFFTDSRTGSGPAAARAQEAKLICSGCQVRAQCLAFAMSVKPMMLGVWGGTDETDRVTIRRRAAGRKPRHAEPDREEPRPS